MATQILTLSENTARRRGLLAEHGVSFLVQTAGATVLFDTGHQARDLNGKVFGFKAIDMADTRGAIGQAFCLGCEILFAVQDNLVGSNLAGQFRLLLR